MAEEIHELHERAHEARENPSLAGATVTMSILAVFVAAVSLLGHRSHTEELLTQSQASDIWAEYQAKSIRRHGYEQIKDLLAAIEQRDTTALQEKYQGEADKARKDQDELQKKAREYEAERDEQRRRANYFDLGEVMLEGALVITSMTLLTRKRFYWNAGIALAVAGLGIAATGFFVR